MIFVSFLYDFCMICMHCVCVLMLPSKLNRLVSISAEKSSHVCIWSSNDVIDLAPSVYRHHVTRAVASRLRSNFSLPTSLFSPRFAPFPTFPALFSPCLWWLRPLCFHRLASFPLLWEAVKAGRPTLAHPWYHVTASYRSLTSPNHAQSLR